MKMVVKNGIQYRPEDAERLGITSSDETITLAQTGAPVIRAGEPVTEASNKARTISTTGTIKAPTAAERKAAEKAAAEERARVDAAANGGATS